VRCDTSRIGSRIFVALFAGGRHELRARKLAQGLPAWQWKG
jgi:hypothetical protein